MKNKTERQMQLNLSKLMKNDMNSESCDNFVCNKIFFYNQSWQCQAKNQYLESGSGLIIRIDVISTDLDDGDKACL
jgi:hypothetical protein